jgi:hypothetical protein
MPTMFRIVFAIIINDVALFVAHTQAVTLCANDLAFLVVRPTFGLVDSFALDLQGVPTFSGQTFSESVPELAVNKFPILPRMITPRFVMQIIFTLVHTQIAFGKFVA